MRPINTKGIARMSTPEAVDKGMAIFAKLEAKAQECCDEAQGFVAVFEAIRGDGHISDFECKALKLEANAIVTAFRAAVWAFHAKTTQRAQLKGIDVPQPMSGGGPR
jgi:hypothetical protein